MDELRRFLVTAPTDLRMDLWAATAMMTNWLEGRDAGRDRETWLVMHSGNPSGFLIAAEKIGVTVEEIHLNDANEETYELLVGTPGTGWASSFWESRNSRATLGGISATWPSAWRCPPDPGEMCSDAAPCSDAECSRERGHTGRHMASLGPAFGNRIVAAWPGVHRPSKADL